MRNPRLSKKNSEMYKKADETAKLNVRELIQPLVSAVSDEYIVEVI